MKLNLKTPFLLMLKSTKLFKVFKLLKFAKFGWMFISMLVSVFVYAYAIGMGLWFSIGFMGMLFIHELGHVLALKLKKLPASAPIFIPGLGAAIFSPDFKDADTEAFVGIGGPILGSLAGLLGFITYLCIPSHPKLLFMVSFIATYINLFNLIPIRPLDGGRVTQAIGPWFKYIGLAVLLLITLKIMQPMMLLIWIIVLDDIPLFPKQKYFISIFCFLAMVGLMCTGFSQQPFWLNVIDVAIALLIINLYRLQSQRKRLPGALPKKYMYESLSRNKKFQWAMIYVLTTAILIGLFVIQSKYFPSVVGQPTHQNSK